MIFIPIFLKKISDDIKEKNPFFIRFLLLLLPFTPALSLPLLLLFVVLKYLFLMKKKKSPML
jgi:hypothetical protein